MLLEENNFDISFGHHFIADTDTDTFNIFLTLANAR